MCKSHVTFQPIPTNPTWWYVIQVAPHSKQIYEDHEHIEEKEKANIIPRSHEFSPTIDIDELIDRQLPTNVNIEDLDIVLANAISNGVDEDDDEDKELKTIQADDQYDHVEDVKIMQNMD